MIGTWLSIAYRKIKILNETISIWLTDNNQLVKKLLSLQHGLQLQRNCRTEAWKIQALARYEPAPPRSQLGVYSQLSLSKATLWEQCKF